jgi:site-specific DNA-adenine methylase
MCFSYYGGKSKIIKYYPKPKFDTIIEPFCGSGCYSYTYGLNKNVWLNDKYEIIYKIWKYLINTTEERINQLPNIKKGDDIRNFNLTQDEIYLMGFCCANGRANPGFTVTAFGDKTHYPKNDVRWRPHSTWQLSKARILKVLPYIKNWKITNEDYLNLPDIEATWYIDPPYMFGGNRYIENKIDYKQLSEWCLSRKGQVIVCENNKCNNWLPFKPLCTLHGSKHKTEEVIWTND